MSFETASVTTCGQSLLARATATNQLVFVNAKIETTTRTASAIGSATALPTLTNPVTGAINSVTYSLNQTRVTVRFNNLVTTANFHTVWLMAKLANEADSAAVPICAVVSAEPVYIPTTSQSDTHIDIHLNLSFVRADGTVSITEGPAWMISDQVQYRNEVRAELDDIEADITDLQDTYVTKGTTQTVTGAKTFNATTTFGGAVQANSTFGVTGATTLAGVTAEAVSSYAITPRIASTSSSTGYDLGADANRWKYVYARYGNFSYSVTVADDVIIGGSITRSQDGSFTQNIGTSTKPFDNVYATTFYGDLSGHATDADWAGYADEAGFCSGNSATATELETARTIDGMSFNGSANITHYGICNTSAATAAKVVSLSGFTLATGARIAVKFTYSNTASNPTLNVNGTGGKAILRYGINYVGTTKYLSWLANNIVEFVYDGSNWVWVGFQYNTYQAYQAESATSATHATYLRYSSTDVLTAASTTSVTSSATISPSSNGGYSLGTSSYKWNYLYCNYIGSSSSYVTSAYITNMYGTATKATADGSGNTITTTYIRIVSVGSSSKTFTTYTAAGGTSSATGYTYNTYLTTTKGDNSTTDTVSLTGLVANIIAGTGVGSIRLVCFKATAAWSKKSSNIYMSGTTLHPVYMRTDGNDSQNVIRHDASSSTSASTFNGVWKLLNYVGEISNGNFVVALAVKVY